ncbi:MFS transporter [Trinickia symbiotica]|uniref:MFS transporter n=1 Tax=Trinickia symbiotica TaxID=863227 RepID=A0A2T3XUW4_9BURK|nr:MFS transporter [Trinickia symbiotica]
MRFPSFQKLLIGQGLSMAGDAVCLAALPVAMLHSGFSGWIFGLVMAAVGLGSVIGALAGGMLADRGSAKHILIATDAARGAAQIAAAMLMVFGAPSWSLVLVYLAFGIGIGVSRPCTQVLLVSLLPKHALVAGNGALNFLDNLVAIVFPATLGVLVILWDPVWGVVIDGITFFGAALFTALLPSDDGKLQSGDELSIREALRGLTVIAGNPELSLGFVATVIVNVLCFPVFLVVAPYAVSDRFSDTMWGVCLAASGVGACIGSVITVLVAGHRHLKVLAPACGLLLCAAMGLLGMGSSAWMAVLGAAFIGVVEASWLTGWATAMQTQSPEERLGKVVAVDTLVTSGVHPFIYLAGGIVGESVGYSDTLIITAFIGAIGTAAVSLAAVRRT